MTKDNFTAFFKEEFADENLSDPEIDYLWDGFVGAADQLGGPESWTLEEFMNGLDQPSGKAMLEALIIEARQHRGN